jgi:hypothetical protein
MSQSAAGAEEGTDGRWDAIARAAAAQLGDVAVVTRAMEKEGTLVTVAVRHKEPSRQLAAATVLGEQYRRGEGLPGRVWEAERGILLVDVDEEALALVAPPTSRGYVREVGVCSLIILPLLDGATVVGTVGVARDPGGAPYTEQDYAQLERLASGLFSADAGP